MLPAVRTNSVASLFSAYLNTAVNHRPDQDPLAALRVTFETVDVVDTFDLELGYLAVARKADDDRVATEGSGRRTAESPAERPGVRLRLSGRKFGCG